MMCSRMAPGCLDQAVFCLLDPGMAEPVCYCYSCLPEHLQLRAQTGQLDPPPTWVYVQPPEEPPTGLDQPAYVTEVTPA